MDDNIITQLSIFVNNEPGRLAHIASVLKECDINMRAFNLAESTEFGIPPSRSSSRPASS